MRTTPQQKYGIGLLIWLLVLGLVAADTFYAYSSERARSYEDVYRASCRVYATSASGRGSYGSGTIFAATETEYYVLTNNHVTGGWSRFECHFFGTGHQTTVNAKLIFNAGNTSGPYDFAILAIREEDLREYNPPYVPIAKEDGLKPEKDKEVIFTGCSEGRWAAVWKGHFTSEPGRTVQFLPAPKGGQSGSGMVQYDENGLPWVVAILTWRIGTENSYTEAQMSGGAIPMGNLYEAIRKQKPAGDWKCPNDWIPVSETIENNTSENAIVENSSSAEPGPDWHYAIIDAEECESPVARNLYKDCEFSVLYFCTDGCAPCEKGKPIMESLRKQGYPILPDLCVSRDNTAKESAEKFNIRLYPTTIVIATWPDGKTRELERIIGAGDLEHKVKSILERYGWNATKEETTQPLETRLRKRLAPDTEETPTPKDESSPDSRPDTAGDLNHLLKLLDGSLEGDSVLPKNEKESPEENAPESPEIPETNDEMEPDNGNSLGNYNESTTRLMDRAAEKIADKAQAAIDRLATNAEAAIGKKIDQMTNNVVLHTESLLQEKILSVGEQLELYVRVYLAKVYLAAVVVVVVGSWSLYQGLGWIKWLCIWLWSRTGIQIVRAGKSQKNDRQEELSSQMENRE